MSSAKKSAPSRSKREIDSDDDHDNKEEEDDEEEDDDDEEEEEKPKKKAPPTKRTNERLVKQDNLLAAGMKEMRLKNIAQVLPYLWIGDADAAMEGAELKKLGIKIIINCASQDVENGAGDSFKYTNFPIPDRDDADISMYYDELFNLITQIKNDNTVAFIHDTDSRNIAPALVIAYMMMSAKKQDKHLPLLKAIQHMEGKYPVMNLSDQIAARLSEKEIELYEMSSIQLTKRVGRGDEKSKKARGGCGGKGKRGK